MNCTALLLFLVVAISYSFRANAQTFTVERFRENPIITPAMLGGAGEDINGPSLIRAPDWLPRPLGKYYLYFAHHEGLYIRLAYADDLHGPWKIYAPGVIQTKELSWNPDHIASPDVLVDDAKHEIRLYFHAPVTPVPKSTDPDYVKKIAEARQDSFMATSKDGLTFKVREESLGPSYFRVWQWRGFHYAFARQGNIPELAAPLLRSETGFAPFERAPRSPFDNAPAFANIRHTALWPHGSDLTVFFTRIGDAPERILSTTIALTDDWTGWRATPPVEVLKPETGYEGVALPRVPSERGSSTKPENGLRDPAIYEENGRVYLLYSVEGERGIAVGELHRK